MSIQPADEDANPHPFFFTGMAELAASKKKNKAQLWEEAKKKEEEEAKNRLMRFR